ncbi:MAG: plasma-membrane proton-efflux P-type ATPase [Desulfobacteraceae bacterium]
MISAEAARTVSIDELLEKLGASLEGLTSEEAAQRLKEYGPNALAEKKVSPLAKFLGYFWGPIPWMIEAAAVLSLIVRDWNDFTIIMLLLVFNASIGFWQESKAANALEALKKQLALNSRARRDGQWQEVATRELVPGDIIFLRLGDVIPADVKLLEGDFLSVDQSALTGESLPVGMRTGDLAYSGSVVKQGEMLALVVSTGPNTFLGRTAGLVQAAGAPSHFQKAVLQIGDYLIYISLGLVALLVLVQLERGAPWLELIQFALILTVASIPVAMPAVLSVTMAVGALALAKMKAVVSRLESIEEMAGIDILCSDKTGTLTQNQLSLGGSILFGAQDEQDLILYASLASKEEDQDPIDLAVIAGLQDRSVLDRYTRTKYVPFDPVHKRTESTVKDSQGQSFKVTKGAPQVIIDRCHMTVEDITRAKQAVIDLAIKGYRTLGVAVAHNESSWEFLGVLSLFDPPRPDSGLTIANAHQQGIRIKMVTGDNVAIAREITQQLGLGINVQPADQLFREGVDVAHLSPEAELEIEQADGYAQVFPEHKYGIVKSLQAAGHIVGMTGDGVNDAPAIKQADVGIAVSSATDAARAAADLVLTAPGLSVIVNAVEEARKIFERMNSYAIYRITETIRIMFFVVLAMLVYNFYPITAVMIILLAFFNDVPIMTIASDNTVIDPQPVRWNMHRVLTVATVLGLIGVIETFGLLIIAKSWLQLDIAQIQTFIFLKLAVAGHLTLFVARTKRMFLTRPYPSATLLWSAIITKLAATLFVVYPLGLMAPITWSQVGLIWAYCITWIFIEDLVKLAVYRQLELAGTRHRHFLRLAKQRIAHFSHWR